MVGNIGKIYENRNDFNSAIEYYEKGISIQERLDDDYGLSINLLNISEVHSKQGQQKKAIEYALLGIDKA